MSHSPDGTRLWRVAAVGAALLLLSCDVEKEPRRNRTSASDTANAVPGAPRTGPTVRDTIPAVQIQWTVAKVLERLRQAGMAAQFRGEVRQPFLAVAGAVIGLPNAEIQVYVYGDAGAAGRDVARLDTSRVAPPRMMIAWTAKPSLIWHNNLVAIVLTRDEGLRARIRQSLEPGGHQASPEDARP